MKSPGFTAETYRRTEKRGSLQFRAVTMVVVPLRSPTKASKPRTSTAETEKRGRCKSLWAKMTLKGLEVKSHEKKFLVEWWGKENEITDTCQRNKVKNSSTVGMKDEAYGLLMLNSKDETFKTLTDTWHGSDGKKSACNAKDLGSIPGSGRSPGERNGNPLQHSCLENSMDRGACWATVHRVAKSRTHLSD